MKFIPFLLFVLVALLGVHHGHCTPKSSRYPYNPSNLFHSKVYPFGHVKDMGWGRQPNFTWYPGIENGLAAAKNQKATYGSNCQYSQYGL